MSILTIMNQIKEKEVVLPAIQRNFIWSEDKIFKLMDSVMRGYPIGIILMWETYFEIQYRDFFESYKPENRPSFKDNSRRNKLKVVLDGQQRLQSLFIALYGQYEGKHLYCDVLSGHESDDFNEDKFLFNFYTPKEAKKINEKANEEAKKRDNNEEDLQYFINVQDLFNMGAKEKQKYSNELVNLLDLNEDDKLRVETNLATFLDVLAKDESILKTSVIDANLPSDSQQRKTVSDVLEIFVRINRQGTPLGRSDLIFSILKLGWKESAEALPDFVSSVNKGNSFNLDTDFVIRCLFAVSDIGTKFNVDLLRNKSNAEKMQENFHRCCDSIRSTVDFVQKECKVASSKLIGSYNTLVPFVYYLFHINKHLVPNAQVENFRKSLYLFGFTKPFSRYADSRLNRFINDEIKPLVKEKDTTFPFEGVVGWVAWWSGIESFDDYLLQQNPDLTLHVLQNLSGAKTQYEANAPEIDHIFPKSELKRKNFKPSEFNDIANLWVLSKGKNRNKSNKPPKKYFADVSDRELKIALIDRDLLTYSSYNKFIKNRKSKMVEKIRKKLGFTEADIAVLNEE